MASWVRAFGTMGQSMGLAVVLLAAAVETLGPGLTTFLEVEWSYHVVREVQLHHHLHFLLSLVGVQNQLSYLMVLCAPVYRPILGDGVCEATLYRLLSMAQRQCPVRSVQLLSRRAHRELLILHFRL